MWGWFSGLFESDKSTVSEGRSSDHPSWWCQNSMDVALVFVHGVMSNGTQCWTAPSGAYWPNLIKEDPHTGAYSIYIAQYYTGVDSGEYDLVQCASALYDSVKQRSATGPRVIDFPRIVFVCHSLGGIVTRRMLEENCQAFGGKEVGLVLLASPSQGSDYAYWFSPLAALYGNKLAAVLIPSDAILLDLDQRFRKMIDENRIPKLIGAEACEHWGPAHFKWLPQIFPKVVPASSASSYFGQKKILERTDHASIAKPDGPNHPSYKFLKTFLLEKFPIDAASSTQVGPPPSGPSNPKSSNVLFDVYSVNCRPFYVERPVDNELRGYVQMGSAWLTGDSGSGKTALVRRYTDQQSVNFMEVSLGSYTDAMTVEQLWVEIASALNVGKEKASLNELAREVNRRGLCMVLDEVPIAKGLGKEIISAICTLSEAVRRCSNGRFCILVCSIEKPDFSGLGTKPLEHLNVIHVPLWEQHEVESLSLLIERELPELKLQDVLRSDLLLAAEGAPRFVKNFYRRRLRANGFESPQVSLNLTKESFVHHGG